MMKTISYLTRLQTRTEIFTIIKYKDIPLIVLTEHCLKKQFVTSTLCAGSILLLFWTFSFDEKSKHWQNRLKAEWNEDYCTLISTGDGLKPISSTIFDFQIIFWTLEIKDLNVQQKWKALYDADTKEAIINLAETPIFTPIKKANTSCHQESEYTHSQEMVDLI